MQQQFQPLDMDSQQLCNIMTVISKKKKVRIKLPWWWWWWRDIKTLQIEARPNAQIHNSKEIWIKRGDLNRTDRLKFAKGNRDSGQFTPCKSGRERFGLISKERQRQREWDLEFRTCWTKLVCITTSRKKRAMATTRWMYSRTVLILGLRSLRSIPDSLAWTRRKVCSGSMAFDELALAFLGFCSVLFWEGNENP